MKNLHKALVFYADNVYFVVFPPGEKVPNHALLSFPVDTRQQAVFSFTIGQMPGISFDEADFEELLTLDVDDFPLSSDGTADVQVELDVRQDGALFVQLSFSTIHERNIYLPNFPQYGPLPLD